MKCKTCGEEIDERRPVCDWQQGRCPHRHPMFNMIVLDKFKMRVYNLLMAIKGWFK